MSPEQKCRISTNRFRMPYSALSTLSQSNLEKKFRISIIYRGNLIKERIRTGVKRECYMKNDTRYERFSLFR